MQRSVYLQGELGEKFGHKFSVHSVSGADVFKCIYANRPSFKEYLIDCVDKDIAFNVKHQEQGLSEEDMLIPLKEGDITISIIPAGSKSGLGKILAAVALVMIGLPMLGKGAFIGPGATFTEYLVAGAGTTTGQIAIGVATNLALAGIQQIMAQDPDTDTNPENYLFDGQARNIKEGDPVPVLYGELRVPGSQVAADVVKGVYQNPMSIIEADGGISTAGENLEETV